MQNTKHTGSRQEGQRATQGKQKEPPHLDSISVNKE